MHAPQTLLRRGFSLTELLAVVTIIGVIGAAVAPHVAPRSSCWETEVDQHYRSSINSAVDRYYAETGNWPACDLSDIEGDPHYFPEGIPVSPVTGEPYRLNAGSHRVE